jgi:5'-nucleotidase/UDP-sugar diphosphatase
MKIWQRTARSAAALLTLCALSTAAIANDFTGNVRIVHINDVHAHVIETKEQIGYPKIAQFIAQERAAHENIIVLDAGDVIAGNPYASVDKGASFAPILNTLGLDVMTAGNAEFVFGSEHLARFRDTLDYPMLVGNMVYKDTEKPFADGHLILDLPNGLRAGIVGVTTPASANMGSKDLKYFRWCRGHAALCR